MRKITDDAERERWVREWRRSKLTAKEFSDKHGLPLSSLYRWSRAAPATVQERGLAPVMRFIEAVPIGARERDGVWVWEFEGPGGVVRGRTLDRTGLTELLAAATGRAK
jgi:hypothetical protein